MNFPKSQKYEMCTWRNTTKRNTKYFLVWGAIMSAIFFWEGSAISADGVIISVILFRGVGCDFGCNYFCYFFSIWGAIFMQFMRIVWLFLWFFTDGVIFWYLCDLLCILEFQPILITITGLTTPWSFYFQDVFSTSIDVSCWIYITLGHIRINKQLIIYIQWGYHKQWLSTHFETKNI